MKTSFIFFYLLIFTINIQSQEAKKNIIRFIAKYKFSFQIDSLNEKSIIEEESILFIGDNISKFQTYNNYLRDSLILIYDKNPSSYINLNQYPKSKFKFDIYKKDDIILFNDWVYSDFYQYTEKSGFNWNLINETSIIKGYNCKKAFLNYAGRKYTAWYTLDIPINEGPYKFNGLPGFIISVQDNKNQVIFVLEEFIKTNSTELMQDMIQDPMKITKKDYRTALKKYKENPLIRLQNDNVNIDEDAKRKILERFKKENNAIELVEK